MKCSKIEIGYSRPTISFFAGIERTRGLSNVRFLMAAAFTTIRGFRAQTGFANFRENRAKGFNTKALTAASRGSLLQHGFLVFTLNQQRSFVV